MEKIIGFFGIFCFLGIAFAFSTNRRRIDLRTVVGGLLLQIVLALLLLGIPALGISGPLRFLFDGMNNFVGAVLDFTNDGSRFVFGRLVDAKESGFIVAFQVLPTILFMAALMNVLYYWGVMQKIMQALAFVMHKTMRISGAESLSVAADIFLGQTESPIVIKPFLPRLTRSELFAVMVGGMSTVAGGVLAAYVGMLKDQIPDIAGHLLAASVMSAPAALIMAKLLIPETENPETMGRIPPQVIAEEDKDNTVVEAAARGAAEGLKLAMNVAAMLIAFIALIALVDAALSGVGEMIGFSKWGSDLVSPLLLDGKPPTLSLSAILGWVFYPVAVLMGISPSEATIAGSLLGQKVVLNEFVAYLNLAKIDQSLTPRTGIMLSYALCGFANFSSIAIQIGGIGGMAPTRTKDLAKLGFKAVLGGTLATILTATIAGLLI